MTKKFLCFIFFGFSFLCSLYAAPFYEQEAWLNLLYYQKTAHGYVSLAHDPNFFITPQGQTDPKGEYDASLKKVQEQDRQFHHMFPLRYKRIALENNLPYARAVTLNPTITNVMIAYPNRYMANPASMFGHLFLILRSQNGLPDSTILHYVASTGSVGPYSYLFKGVTGQFKGWFFTEPYFRKIKEYTYRDDREVLFYDLNLSSSQIEDIQLHARELERTFFHYYFFDQNCAFFIGKFLNVIYNQPIQKNPAVVLPSDIINTLNQNGFLEHAYYRGTLTKQFDDSYYALNRSEKKEVIQLILKPQEKVPSDARILKPFLYISDYVLNNYGTLADPVRKNRILAYQTLEKQGEATIRPELETRPFVHSIPSKALRLEHGLSSEIRATYHHVYYGNSGQNISLDNKQVLCLSPGISISSQAPTQLEFTFAEILNIAPYNNILNSNSWRLKSWFGYNSAMLTTQSFDYGRAYRPFSKTLITGLAGLSLSNYNDITQQPLDHLTVQPTARLELAQLIHPSVKASLGYDYRFGKHHLEIGGSFKKAPYEGRAFYVVSKDQGGVCVQVLKGF